MRFINTLNLGFHHWFLGLINLIFPSESGYNYYLFPINNTFVVQQLSDRGRIVHQFGDFCLICFNFVFLTA